MATAAGNLRIRQLLTLDGAPLPLRHALQQFGLTLGTRLPELDAPFAVNIAGLPLAPGRYEWQVEIDRAVVGRVPFTVMES